MTTHEIKTAAIYARVSTVDQAEQGLSIPAQIKACSSYILNHGWTVANEHIYRDEGRSGSTDDRLGFQTMITDAKRHRFDVILVHKFDRFARSVQHSSFYKAALRREGIAVISVQEPLEKDDPVTIIIESLLDAISEYYKANLARETVKGQRENAQQGGRNGGQAPYGYQLTSDGDLEPDPATAPYVQEIFQRYVAGDGLAVITSWLNTVQAPLPRGNRGVQSWSKNTLYSILRNPAYTGDLVWNRQRRRKHTVHDAKWNAPEDWITTPNTHPALIDREVFNSIPQIAAARDRLHGFSGNPNGRSVYPTSGLITCGICGAPYQGQRHTRRREWQPSRLSQISLWHPQQQGL